MRTLFVLVVTMLLATMMGYSDRTSANAVTSTVLPTQTSEGVVLHGCTQQEKGWIENTNSYPVRVRRVWQYYGERTESINRLEPGAKLMLDKISHQHGFYIYTMDGVLVGWISGECPKK